jgi:hypothetical protein
VERIRRLVPSYQHRTPHRTGITAGLKRMIFTTSFSCGTIVTSAAGADGRQYVGR